MIYDLRKTDEFLEWYAALRDARARAAIVRRLRRAESGNFGDCKAVKACPGLREMRVEYGPGFRLYLGRKGRTVYIVVAGGTKASQTADIEAACSLWAAIKAGEYVAY